MPGERILRYYEEKAKGGLGLILCFGSASVHATSPAKDWNGIELFDDRVIPHLERFSETMHGCDVPVIAQITHRGRRGRSTASLGRLYAPSAIREPKHRETPHELDEAMAYRGTDSGVAEGVNRFQRHLDRTRKAHRESSVSTRTHEHDFPTRFKSEGFVTLT